jgi:serine/threonine protein kinase
MAQPQSQGRTLGMYQFGPFQGAGPIGDVYRAHAIGREPTGLAIKLVRQPFAGSTPVRSRLQMVSGLMAHIDHPHILPLEYAGDLEGQLVTVTPFVEQGSLMTRLSRGRLSPKDVAPLFKQICDALGYAHSQGLVHGNLKPTNVMLFEGRHVLLMDFGHLWQVPEMDLTRSGLTTDAVLYMAPEQAEGVADVRSDVYSLGVMLFHTLTGSPPYAGRTPFEILSRHQRQPVPTLSVAQGLLPPGALVFDDVLHMALAKDPGSRFQSAVAMERAIVEAGALANDLPSRVMPSLRPNSVPLLAPPQQRFTPQAPGMQPPSGYGYSPAPQLRPPSQPIAPAFPPTPQPMPPGYPSMQPLVPQYQQPPPMPPGYPPSRPVSPTPMPQALPPQAPPDDPLAWLLPDSTPNLPGNRQPDQDLADFLTARHSAPSDSILLPNAPPTSESRSVPVPTDETGSVSRADDAWWGDEDGDSRAYTGYSSARGPAVTGDWDATGGFDASRSMQAPSLRQPARRGISRDQWEESAPDSRRRRYDDDASREMSRQAPASRPRRGAYDDDGWSVISPAARRSRAAPAPRKKKSRLPAILGVTIAALALVNVVLVIVKAPNLCPNHVCDALHNHIIKLLPGGFTPFPQTAELLFPDHDVLRITLATMPRR